MKKNRTTRYQVATFLMKCIGVRLRLKTMAGQVTLFLLFLLFAFAVMADDDLIDYGSSAEPDKEAFIATTGLKDPVVPQTKDGWVGDANKEIPVMQIRTKSVEIANEITEISVKIASGSNMKFGDHIPSVSLYQDMDGDGTGDVLLQRKTVLEETGPVFKDFDVPLTYSAHDSKFFVIKADMSGIKSGQKAIFLIDDGSLVLRSNVATYGLPIHSRVFECKDGISCPDNEYSDADTVDTDEENSDADNDIDVTKPQLGSGCGVVLIENI